MTGSRLTDSVVEGVEDEEDTATSWIVSVVVVDSLWVGSVVEEEEEEEDASPNSLVWRLRELFLTGTESDSFRLAGIFLERNVWNNLET